MLLGHHQVPSAQEIEGAFQMRGKKGILIGRLPIEFLVRGRCTGRYEQCARRAAHDGDAHRGLAAGLALQPVIVEFRFQQIRARDDMLAGETAADGHQDRLRYPGIDRREVAVELVDGFRRKAGDIGHA
ncbi:hypothetical protein D9M70_466360 [compost metagenome]